MPTMFALVGVLEFLDINDYGSTALLDEKGGGSSKLAKTEHSRVSWD